MICLINLRSIWIECLVYKKRGLLKIMNYFLNEYSMRGQFKDVDDFFESLRIYTLPALKKIEEQAGNLIWKKDTFWQLEICNGIILSRIPRKKNERSAEWVS